MLAHFPSGTQPSPRGEIGNTHRLWEAAPTRELRVQIPSGALQILANLVGHLAV